MSFTITSAKLAGNPDSSGWAQIHEFKPEDDDKFNKRGHLFAVIATKGEGTAHGGVDSTVVGRELLARLHEEYFGNTKSSAFNALKDAVAKVVEEFSDSSGDVEIVAASLLGDVVYTSAVGGTQVAIARGGMFAKVLKSEKPARQSGRGVGGEVISASGYPKASDILFLATKRFFDVFPGGTLKVALSGHDPKAAVESLAPTVHATPETGSLGAVFIKFGKGKVARFAGGASRQAATAAAGDSRSRLANFFSRLTKILPEPRVYVRRFEEDQKVRQGRKVAASIGVILLLLLIVSIGFGIRQRRVKLARREYEARLTQATHEFEEALSLFSLNPARARELLRSSRREVDALLDAGVDVAEVKKLKENITQSQIQILGEYQVTSELFVDLSILTEGLSADVLSATVDDLFILDKEGRRIVRVSIDTKKTKVIAGPDQITEAKDVSAFSDRVFITTSRGIVEIGEKDLALKDEWDGETFLSSYAGNLYVLNKATSSVLRYPGLAPPSGGFGTQQNWLAPGIDINLSGVTQMIIDGSIWFLFDSGKIMKLTRGSPEKFSVSSVSPELLNPVAIYTNEELSSLYVLDPGKSRVVVLDKSGEYKAQYLYQENTNSLAEGEDKARQRTTDDDRGYLSEDISQAKDLAVSEKEGKIILLTDQALYSIELQHLKE